MTETAAQELARRVKAVREEYGCDLFTAKDFVLRNDARLAAAHALDELRILIGEDAARHLDDLIKARITEATGS